MKYLIQLFSIVLCVACARMYAEDRAETIHAPGVHVVTLGVSDLDRSFRFYRDGLRFPTAMTPEGGVVLFTTNGAKLFLYPFTNLARDSGFELEGRSSRMPGFAGFTFSYGVATRGDVDLVLLNAERAGGTVLRSAHDVSWGAYVGYFSDPDGYVWEIAYSDLWHFSDDGVLIFNQKEVQADASGNPDKPGP